MIRIELPFLYLETKRKSLIFEVRKCRDDQNGLTGEKKVVTLRYFGNRENVPELVPEDLVLNKNGSNCEYLVAPLLSSTYGNGNNAEPLLLVDNPDGTSVNRFRFREARRFSGAKDLFGPKARNVSETLEIIETDEAMDLELHHYFSLFDDSDVIVSKKEIVSENKKPVVIRRLFSLELPLPFRKVSVTTYDGEWLLERQKHVSNLESGIFLIDSKVGTCGHRHNPFFHVRDEETGQIVAVNLIYSGNHRETVEVDSLHGSTLFAGISDFSFAYELLPGESFLTPEAAFTSAESEEEMTSGFHSFILNHVLSPDLVRRPRPIIFNNWEGTGVDIDEKSLLEMADIASSVGVEQFVIDDGWFLGRTSDDRALGDWRVDPVKFPSGLKSFADKVRSKGLRFGIWVEPEMISVNSDLYRAHPDYAQIIPGRAPLQRRTQLVLDFTNPEVVMNIFLQLDRLIQEIRPDYIKWDYNRFITDPYSATGTKKGGYLYAFIQGVYSLFEKITGKYPDLLIEGCASGGGRFDLGMLYYTPQIWGSDNTSTYERAYINTGTLMGYPQSTLGTHVSRDFGLSNRRASLEDRFNLNCFGAFGYEFDFRKVSEKDLGTISRQTAFYREYRDVLQYGNFYLNDSPFDGDYLSYGVVNDDRSLSLCLIGKMSKTASSHLWCMKGLEDESRYEVSVRPQDNAGDNVTELGVHSGKELRTLGLEIDYLFRSSDDADYPDGIITRLLLLKKAR